MHLMFDLDLSAPARALGFAGALVCIGAIPARTLLRRTWNGEADAEALKVAQRRLTWVVCSASLLLPLAVLMALRAQALQLVDEGERLSATQYGLALASGWGAAWRAQAAAAALAVVAWLPRNGQPRLGPRLAPIAALALAATLPLTGHFRVVPSGLLLGVLTGALHLIGGGLWLGTLALIASVGWSGGADGRGSRVARLVTSFSPLALTGAAITGLSGVVAAWQTVASFSALIGSPYGRTLLLKLGCLVGVAALGAYNWRVVQPRLTAGTGEGLLRRSAFTELTLGAILLLITALLVVLPAPGLE
jgi:putative copper export protein